MRWLLRWILVSAIGLLVVAPVASAAPPAILVVGDSISTGYGVAVEESWVAKLRKRLAARGYAHRVVNASVSGDTTSSGLARLPDALAQHDPAVVIIELGGNDGLRGQPASAMADNLAEMVEQSQAAGARALLLGLRLPPNYGPAYTEQFAEVYRKVAERSGAALVPRMLEGVGERRDRMQGDGIHPNASGHSRILDNIWPHLRPLLEGSGGH
ncbi:arylesterase [Thiohalorhabdus methylotrophus]|uniref:Arylesterase n=1 Tax=Thiohalorhabdus methylotrophus TaxID=3242694 RepID=A0ABV4TY67_9GAMM